MTEEAAFITKGKEPQNTASGTDNASSQVNAPRIGFKHDPAEEAIMAQVEPDTEIAVGRKKKKKNKRSKSQRGLVRPSGFFFSAEITNKTFRMPRLGSSHGMPMLR